MGETERAGGAQVAPFDRAAYHALHRRFDHLRELIGKQTEFFAALGRSVAELQRSVGEVQRDIGSLRADVSELRGPDAPNVMHLDAAREDLAAARRDVAEAVSAMREALERMPAPDKGGPG
jgi:predicted  nucleic acid-binding Zn-ribbon protein